MIKIKVDTLTPKLKSVQKRMGTAPPEYVRRLLKFAKGVARSRAMGSGTKSRTGNLVRGIGYRVYKKSGRGVLFCLAKGTSGFEYSLWVNKNIPIITTKSSKYFKQGQGQIWYGEKGVLSPSGKNIQWDIKTKLGFFDQTFIDVQKRFFRTKNTLITKIFK